MLDHRFVIVGQRYVVDVHDDVVKQILIDWWNTKNYHFISRNKLKGICSTQDLNGTGRTNLAPNLHRMEFDSRFIGQARQKSSKNG